MKEDSEKRRAVTPIIKKEEEDSLDINIATKATKGEISAPRRTSSIKKLELDEKKNKFKGKVAWQAPSPKNLLASPSKSTILKKELLDLPMLY